MKRKGYTVVELMVTIVIVAVFAAVVGTFIVKLLTIKEREREEAYIKEKLSDACAIYADFLSVGSSISVSTDTNNQAIVVGYRLETDGISLETGLVTRAAYLVSTINATNGIMDLSVFSRDPEHIPSELSLMGHRVNRKLSRKINGDAPLIPLVGDMVRFSVRPIATTFEPEPSEEDLPMQTSNSALGYLEASAQYRIKNDEGEMETKTATVGRLVRLWNKK